MNSLQDGNSVKVDRGFNIADAKSCYIKHSSKVIDSSGQLSESDRVTTQRIPSCRKGYWENKEFQNIDVHP